MIWKSFTTFHLLWWATTAAAFQPMLGDLLPFYYPLMPSKQAHQKVIHRVEVAGVPLVCYKSKNDSFVVHSDVCPHQGASLSRGWVNHDGNLQCPYHGFEFCQGMFCKIPNPEMNPRHFRSKTMLDLFPTLSRGGLLFLHPQAVGHIRGIGDPLEPPFFPPEEYDVNFKSTEGTRLIDSHYMTVCENLLDMLHISYVHSFGSALTPLPSTISGRNLTRNSFRTEFVYQPRDFTISGKVGRVSKVSVQNEFHLPTNTITRVMAGSTIKTVFTRSLPVSEHQTLLFWKVYRNFWIDPNVDFFTSFGDHLMRFLMEKTIDEDVEMLRHVYPQYREGPLRTRYDMTIENFRKRVRSSIENNHGR